MPDLPILNGHPPAPTLAGHDRLTDTVAGHIAQTLRAAAMGERVSYETGMVLVPTPQGMAPSLAIYMQIPSPILGELCVEMVCLELHKATGPNVAQVVTEMVGRLFATRARMATAPTN